MTGALGVSFRVRRRYQVGPVHSHSKVSPVTETFMRFKDVRCLRLSTMTTLTGHVYIDRSREYK